jgi:hypothetical protein
MHGFLQSCADSCCVLTQRRATFKSRLMDLSASASITLKSALIAVWMPGKSHQEIGATCKAGCLNNSDFAFL